MNSSSPIPNLTNEKTIAQGERETHPWSCGENQDGSHSAQSCVFSFSDLNGENRCRGKKSFFQIKYPWEQNKSEETGRREGLHDVQNRTAE